MTTRASGTQQKRFNEIADSILLSGRRNKKATWEVVALKLGPAIDSDEADEAAINKRWFLHALCDAYLGYYACFDKLKSCEYYDAWCELERLEILLLDLTKNPVYPKLDIVVDYIRDKIVNTQALFPYRIFMSPEILETSKHCSVCGSRVSPWSNCGHVKGKLYRGKIAHHIINECKFIGISFVTEPVQKYSVAFVRDESEADQFDYAVLKFLVDRLDDALDGWSFVLTEELRPHNLFSSYAKDGFCPCGSGRTYVNCCLQRSGVSKPHIQFQFDVEPPPHLPTLVLPHYA